MRARPAAPRAGFVWVDEVIGLRKQDMAAAENLLDQFCPVPPEVEQAQAQEVQAAQQAWSSDTPYDAVAAAARSSL